MTCYLGIDIGTTSVKAVAFNDDGEIIHKNAVGYEMMHPQRNFSEHDPEEIYQATISAVNKTLDELFPDVPVFFSFSAMMHSLIAVDEDGQPLTNCMLWADNRAADLAEELRKTEKGEAIYRATGVPIHAMSPFCKLLWLEKHQPEIFHGAHKFIGIKEYVFYKLFHEFTVDTAIASSTGLLNIESLEWDKSVLDLLQLSTERLSRVVDTTEIFTWQPNRNVVFHLEQRTPFVIGGSDGALANIGTGSVANNSVSITIGTSAAVRILSEVPIRVSNMSLFCYHAHNKQYIIGGASNNGAVVIEWLKDSLLEASESFDELFDLAETIPTGCDDLIFIPYILGERAPVWNSEARGIFFGLAIGHSKGHLIRAAMEGICYNLFSIGKPIMELAPVREIYAAGGFAQSSLWLQILADVFNCRVLVSGSVESSALGAVIVGLEALKLPVAIKPGVVSEHLPNPKNHLVYQQHFAKFERIYEALKHEFVRTPMGASILSD